MNPPTMTPAPGPVPSDEDDDLVIERHPRLYWEPFGRHTALIFQLIFWLLVYEAIKVTVGFGG